MNYRKAGLYNKFIVQRPDGRDMFPADKHWGCPYFVLDLQHDPYAIPALKAYAEACREKFPELAEDLDAIVENPQLAVEMSPFPNLSDYKECPHCGCAPCSCLYDEQESDRNVITGEEDELGDRGDA